MADIELVKKVVDEDIERVVEEFRALLEFSTLEIESCPWLAKQRFHEFIKEIKNEANEVLRANNPCEQLEEIADVFRDSLLAMLLAKRENLINDIHLVLRNEVKKIKKRKPWLLDQKHVTLSEAEAIWNHVKVIEKNQKRNYEFECKEE